MCVHTIDIVMLRENPLHLKRNYVLTLVSEEPLCLLINKGTIALPWNVSGYLVWEEMLWFTIRVGPVYGTSLLWWASVPVSPVGVVIQPSHVHQWLTQCTYSSESSVEVFGGPSFFENRHSFSVAVLLWQYHDLSGKPFDAPYPRLYLFNSIYNGFGTISGCSSFH